MRGSPSAITRISPISPSARSRDSVRSVMSWRCAPRLTTSRSLVSSAGIFSADLSPHSQEKNKRIRMDIRKVKKLIELLEESGIAEIEISEGEESVRISRYPQGQAHAPFVHYAAPPPAPAAPAPVAAPVAAPAAAPVPAKADHTVTAPMVGTFYAAATPGA